VAQRAPGRPGDVALRPRPASARPDGARGRPHRDSDRGSRRRGGAGLMLQLALDGAIALLLVLTLGVGVRLHLALRGLRRDNTDLEALIGAMDGDRKSVV